MMTAEQRPLGFCDLVDVSSGGAKLKVTRQTAVPEQFVLILSINFGPRKNCQVVWRESAFVGVRFLPDEAKVN
jgi:hypothetical protein